jgi:hypothetical protein
MNEFLIDCSSSRGQKSHFTVLLREIWLDLEQNVCKKNSLLLS